MSKYGKYIPFAICLYVAFQVGFPKHHLFLYCALFSFFTYEIIHAIFVDFVKISDNADRIWFRFSFLFIVLLLVMSIFFKETFLILFTLIFFAFRLLRINLDRKEQHKRT